VPYKTTAKRRAIVRRSVAAWKTRHPGRAKEKQRSHYRRYAEYYRAKARKYYRDHRAKRLAYAKRHHKKHRSRLLAEMKAAAAARKQTVMAHYGGACHCCGISHLAFLTIDHIEGRTRATRRIAGSGQRTYQYLIRHHFPPGYQVLCWNCNQGRAVNGGICPHLHS
jgi:hypothetical protein